MAKAVNDTRAKWQELTVFATDDAVTIDNNASEREMKRVVLKPTASFSQNGGRPRLSHERERREPTPAIT